MTKRNKQRPRNVESTPAGGADSGANVGWPARSLRIVALLLTLAVFAVYGPALRAPFIYDDEDVVLHNTSIERLWPLVGTEAAPGPLNPRREISTSGRPLVNLSLALNYRWGRFDPLGYHVVNVLLHVTCVLLLWQIVRLALRLPAFARRFDRSAEPLAALTALAWALHPLVTETVVYVTQRTELMVGVCLLATLYACLRYWDATGAAKKGWLALAIMASLAGMACKEVMVTAPVVVLLFEYTFRRRSVRQTLEASWPLYVGLAASWLLLVVLNFSGPRAGSAGFRAGVPAVHWWLTQTYVLWMYLRLAIWPWPLSIHYDIPYLETLSAAWPWVLLTGGLVAVTLFGVWRRWASGFVLGVVFIILSPTLVVPIATEVAAERRMYLPLAALTAWVIVGGFELMRLLSRPRDENRAAPKAELAITATLVVAAAIVLCYGGASSWRLRAYRDPVVLWRDVVQKQPGSSVAHTNLGVVLAASGQAKEAIAEYEQALALKPSQSTARSNLAEAYYDLALRLIDGPDPAGAIPLIDTALEIEPEFANAHYALGGVYAGLGNLPAAEQHFSAAARIRPGYVEALVNLGLVRMNQGQFATSAAAFQQALAEQPNNADAAFGLAMAMARQGNRDEAQRAFERASALDPTRAEIRFEWANLCIVAQRPADAIVHYSAAVKLKPDYVEALQNLGAALLSVGQVEQAVGPLEAALRLQPNNAAARANLERARARGK